jgi:hypothetical protein
MLHTNYPFPQSVSANGSLVKAIKPLKMLKIYVAYGPSCTSRSGTKKRYR